MGYVSSEVVSADQVQVAETRVRLQPVGGARERTGTEDRPGTYAKLPCERRQTRWRPDGFWKDEESGRKAAERVCERVKGGGCSRESEKRYDGFTPKRKSGLGR